MLIPFFALDLTASKMKVWELAILSLSPPGTWNINSSRKLISEMPS
jgi:hypothetical protein